MEDKLPFHRKYRPVNISDYIGNSVRNIMISRFVGKEKLPQTILLYGHSGCGKTTAARLIAKEYNCLNKVSGRACGKCEMCLELEERLIFGEAGLESSGVQEVDIASESGKAAMDSLLEEALIEPLYPIKYKILILDECHMATRQAQNRLLKIVEEPPKHLVFIFCTTDVDQLLDTLKNRCQIKIEVRKPTIDEIVTRLLYVSEKEGLTVSKEALALIAKRADRVPREALNILENIANHFDGEVTIKNVTAFLGELADNYYFEYYNKANSSLEDILEFVRELKESGINYKDFMKGLTNFTLDAVYAFCGIGIEDYSAEYVKAIKKLFNIYNSDDLCSLLMILENANKLIDTMKEDKSELILLTTSLRISKLKYMADDLRNTSTELIKENKKSVQNCKAIYNKELENRKVVNLRKAEDVVLSVLGGNLARTDEKVEKIEEFNVLGDEELLKYFKD